MNHIILKKLKAKAKQGPVNTFMIIMMIIGIIQFNSLLFMCRVEQLKGQLQTQHSVDTIK
jgi:hypothetical protein